MILFIVPPHHLSESVPRWRSRSSFVTLMSILRNLRSQVGSVVCKELALVPEMSTTSNSSAVPMVSVSIWPRTTVIVHLVRYCITTMENDISDRGTVSAVDCVELHILINVCCTTRIYIPIVRWDGGSGPNGSMATRRKAPVLLSDWTPVVTF
jgi:hypothetical protein